MEHNGLIEKILARKDLIMFWYSMFFLVVVLGLLFWISGILDKTRDLAHKTLFGFEQVTREQVIDSVQSHSLDFKGKYVELTTKVEQRNFSDSIMLDSHSDGNDVWWYVDTFEKTGHESKYNYKVGETYTFKVFIKSIDYKPADAYGEKKDRYLIFSRLVK